MPWKETGAMDERVKLIGDYLDGQWSITELSEVYGVSRKTIYKWVDRYCDEGIQGLDDRSRAPLIHPNAVGQDIIQMIVKEKLEHQKWGPKKVATRLKVLFPERHWPVVSTIGEILKRQGLVSRRHVRRRTPPYTRPFVDCQESNAVWSADFKGQFRTGDNRMCYPFTLTDNYSRYLLACHGLRRPTTEATKPWLEWAFREYGLPCALKTDNGSPFASTGLGGLSQLSVWLIKLGIRPERIKAGHPEQNGRHERMHRTLKEETANPPQEDLQKQQRTFDRFIREYNQSRPHEALGQNTPASIYTSSPIHYPAKLPEVEYDNSFRVRRVRHNGEIKWKGQMVYVSQALAGEPVGLTQIDDELWKVNFSFHPLGVLDEKVAKITYKQGKM